MATTAQALPIRRFSSLQIGRGLAAALVVLHHIVGRAHVAGVGLGQFEGFGFGFLGVDFFFVLSGFIIAHTLSKPGLSAAVFAWHRAARIFPVFWLVFAISALAVLVMPHLLGHEVHYSASELFKAALLIRQDIADGRSNPPIVGVAWTLHHEMWFYLIASLWLLWPRAATAIAAAVLLGSLRVPQTYPATFLFNPLNLEFAFGVAAYVAHRRMAPSANWAAIACGVLLLPVLCQVWPPLDQFVGMSRVWSAGLPLALIVAGLAGLEWTGAREERDAAGGGKGGSVRRAFEWLGDCSYALYLSHYPVMLVCLKLGRLLGVASPGGFLAYLLATLVACIAVAAAIHHGFERPVQRLLSLAKRPRRFLPGASRAERP